MSKVYTPNYTQVPNVVIDDLAAKLSDAAFKIYVVLIRKTKGWDQNRDAIAISQFMDLTGKSKPTVVRAIDELINLGLIKKTRFTKHGNEYELNLTFSHVGIFLKFRCKKSLLVKNFNIKSKEFLLLEVKNFDTQKILSKDTIKDTSINKGKNSEVKKFDPSVVELPSNIDKQLWLDFIEMRKKIKKKLTEKAVSMILKDLVSFGHLANESLKNSIKSSWSGVYLPKRQPSYSTPQSRQTPSMADYMQQEMMRDVTPDYQYNFLEHKE